MRRSLSDWLKYERLHHYPELSCFEPPEALKRLQAYEREEREAVKHWLDLGFILIVLFSLLWICLMVLQVGSLLTRFLSQIPLLASFAMQYVLYRRIRKRVKAKVAAELRDGRVWTCIECGYDLRASAERCPECGATFPLSLRERAGVREPNV